MQISRKAYNKHNKKGWCKIWVLQKHTITVLYLASILKDLNISEVELNTEYTVRGAFISKGGKYGDSPSIIMDDCFLNIPKHLVEDIRDLMTTPEAVEQVEAGLLAFSVYEYEDSNGKVQRSIKWIDK